ncbi:MerR family DNA-binding protein [Kangiella marina]|uniref:Hg(II)-responsive transcriptional regulator n=1 Tax=Kangiella marina TaxID=1079178 RepID=A0ABP8ING8_9GAMM
MRTIGFVAKELGISVETIKFYERKGLIKQPVKPESGYRVYDHTITQRIEFILKAKTLGFTLNEISSLLRLSNDCKEVERIGLKKLAVIQEKINDLRKLETVIKRLTENCQNNQDATSCPIIESLSNS